MGEHVGHENTNGNANDGGDTFGDGVFILATEVKDELCSDAKSDDDGEVGDGDEGVVEEYALPEADENMVGGGGLVLGVECVDEDADAKRTKEGKSGVQVHSEAETGRRRDRSGMRGVE